PGSERPASPAVDNDDASLSQSSGIVFRANYPVPRHVVLGARLLQDQLHHTLFVGRQAVHERLELHSQTGDDVLRRRFWFRCHHTLLGSGSRAVFPGSLTGPLSSPPGGWAPPTPPS